MEQGNQDRAISRLITLLERKQAEGIVQLKELYPRCGRAHVIGVTGPPGAGKSCLVSALIREFRADGKSVGVLAVDPSSPFTGGALLGDRARMTDFARDPDVYIRSFSARGASGGLAAVINDAVDVLDAFGKQVILIETVGVGQVEVDIAKLAHSVVLTLVPGYGDSLQAIKAGILEIADVVAMNKADQPGADKAVNELAGEMPISWKESELPCLSIKEHQWLVPIVKVSALRGDGLENLHGLLKYHREFLAENDLFKELGKRRRRSQFTEILGKQVTQRFLEKASNDHKLQRWLQKIETLEVDPYTATEEVICLIERAHRREIDENLSRRLENKIDEIPKV